MSPSLRRLVARYDRDAALTIFAPVAENARSLIDDRFNLSNEAAAILQAAALFDPLRGPGHARRLARRPRAAARDRAGQAHGAHAAHQADGPARGRPRARPAARRPPPRGAAQSPASSTSGPRSSTTDSNSPRIANEETAMRIGPRIRPRSVGCFLGLALLAVAVSGSARGEGIPPGAAIRGVDDPRPAPAETAVGSPPRRPCPGSWCRASTTLFEQGLADPRGCDYRAIEVAVGSVWSNVAGIASTHGWVLPERPGETTRFAVAWSGLVYPTVSVGAPADLEADVKALETTARARREALRDRPGTDAAGAFGGFGTNHEAYSVSLQGVHPIKVGAAPAGRPRRPRRARLGRGDGPDARGDGKIEDRSDRLRRELRDDGQ